MVFIITKDLLKSFVESSHKSIVKATEYANPNCTKTPFSQKKKEMDWLQWQYWLAINNECSHPLASLLLEIIHLFS